MRSVMERLHAYWRMPYVKAPKKDGLDNRGKNPFEAMARSSNFRKYGIIWKGEYSFIILNKFPYNCGHLLVLPKREVGDIEFLHPDEKAEFFDAIIRAKRILRLAMNPDGFNIGFNLGSKAGAGIPTHLHCHVVPRWDGDTNFMPVVADTKVLPQSLGLLWEKLVKFADK